MDTPAIPDRDLATSTRRSRRRRRVRWAIVLLALVVLPAATIRELQFFSNPTNTGVYFRVKPVGPVRFTYIPHLGSLSLSITHGQNARDPQATTAHLFVGRHNRIAVTDADRPYFMLDEHHRFGVR